MAVLVAVLFAPQGGVKAAGVLSRAPNNLGLVGYWPLDDGSGTVARDASGIGDNGALVSSPTWVTGQLGGALNFNGSNARVVIPATQWPQNAFTASIWIKPSSITNADLFSAYCGGTCSPHGAYLQFGVLSGGILFARIQQSLDTIYIGRDTSAGLITTGKWYHIVMTWSGGTTNASISIYVNGVKSDSANDGAGVFTGAYSGNNVPMWLGGQNFSGPDSMFAGALDDARIYNRALSQTDVTALYNIGAAKLGATKGASSQSTLISSGLVGYWTFDGKNTNWASGTTLDSSGSGDTGTLISMSTSTSPVLGKLGQAMSFNGSTQYVVVSSPPVAPPSGASARTMSGWVKTNGSVLSRVAYFGYGGTGTDISFNFESGINGDGKDWFVNFGDDLQGTKVIGDGKWHFIAVTYTGTIESLYVDGALDVSAAKSLNTGSIPTFPLDIGRQSYADGGNFHYLNGTVDDVRIYNRALSATEIQELYQAGNGATLDTSNPQALSGGGLVGDWNFDGKYMNWVAGQTLDSSGFGNNGSLTDMSTTTSPAIGKIGQALSFNGTNQRITYSNIPSFNFGTSDFSVSFWMKPSPPWGTVATVGVIGQKTGDGANGWQIYQDGNHPGDLDMRITQTNNFVTISSIPTGTWTYVTFVRKSGALSWYLNGALNTTGSNSSNISDTAPFYIGYAQTWGAYYAGSLDDVRIYNRAISASEIQALYNLGK